MPLIPIISSLGSFIVSFWLTLKGWIVWLFGVYLVGRIVKILLFLGIGVATYQFGSFSLDVLFGQIVESLDGVGEMTIGLLHRMGVFEALSIVFGAISARLTAKGLTSLTSIRR